MARKAEHLSLAERVALGERARARCAQAVRDSRIDATEGV